MRGIGLRFNIGTAMSQLIALAITQKNTSRPRSAMTPQ
jgi:hypothetical protein